MRKRNISITEGPLFSSIIRFAIPLTVSSLLQNLFNAADVAVVGNMSNDNAVAAVGVNASIIGLMVNSVIGIAAGAEILLARLLGAKNSGMVKRCVNTSMILSVILGLFAAVVGNAFAPLILRAIDCPEDIFAGALTYLRLYLFAAPFISVYNFGAAVIRINGDSDHPLYYMIYCGILNVVLNLSLCFLLEDKVAAVGIATLTAQILGSALVIRHLLHMEEPCKIDFKRENFSFSVFGQVLRLGIPCAINNSLYSIANLQIQSAMNSFGTAAVAGNTACLTIESLMGCFDNDMASTAMAFAGQNLGAKRPNRVKKSLLITLSVTVLSNLIAGFIVWRFSDFFLGLVIPGQTEAIAFGKIRVFYLVLFYFLSAIICIFSASLRAFGYPTLQTVQSMISVLAFRVVWMFFIFPLWPTFTCLFQCFLVSWLLTIAGTSVMLFIVVRKYRRGKLKNLY